VTLLLFLMFWGMLWGLAGMLLATPFAVLVKIVLTTVPEGKRVADLMAGRYQY
jgi:AI-2 transport protein TqsA